MPGHVAVYLPLSYNSSGQTVIVPRDRIEDVALAGSEVMAFIVSGGVTEVGVGSAERTAEAVPRG